MKYKKIRYKDIQVSYLPELDGGGTTFGQAFLDVVREKLGHVEHAFEFCAGPGFIGFSMLANGLCDRLTLADINPDAVRACEATIRENGLEDRVKVYLSDCLDAIPETEKWDLVVSNPPHWDRTDRKEREALRLIDPSWQLHKRFYASVGKYLRPGGSVIMQENAHATREDLFAPMIRANGMRVVETFLAPKDRSRLAIRPPKVVTEFSQTVIEKVFWPIERALMTPRIERFVKDNELYRRLSVLPALTPSQFYFIWSKAANHAAATETPAMNRSENRPSRSAAAGGEA